MNMRYLLSFIACLTVLFALLLMAGCQKNAADAEASAAPDATAVPTEVVTEVPTEVPTEAPTEVPTEATTPEPTATPVPADWYIDPRGIIPKDVEIAIPDNGYSDPQASGIVIKDGNPYLVIYTKNDGKICEQRLPKEFLDAVYVSSYCDEQSISARGYQTTFDDPDGYKVPYWIYYQIGNKYFMFEAITHYYGGGTDKDMLIATADGKAIWYKAGDDFYQYHDFGEGANVYVDANKVFCVNDKVAFDLSKETAPMKDVNGMD